MAASWKVTGDMPDQVFFIAGQPVSGHLISFITGNGHPGSVQVADHDYVPARVRGIIAAKATVVDQVNGLSEGSVPVTG